MSSLDVYCVVVACMLCALSALMVPQCQHYLHHCRRQSVRVRSVQPCSFRLYVARFLLVAPFRIHFVRHCMCFYHNQCRTSTRWTKSQMLWLWLGRCISGPEVYRRHGIQNLIWQCAELIQEFQTVSSYNYDKVSPQLSTKVSGLSPCKSDLNQLLSLYRTAACHLVLIEKKWVWFYKNDFLIECRTSNHGNHGYVYFLFWGVAQKILPLQCASYYLLATSNLPTDPERRWIYIYSKYYDMTYTSNVIYIFSVYSAYRLTWHEGKIPDNEVWIKLGGDKGGGSF